MTKQNEVLLASKDPLATRDQSPAHTWPRLFVAAALRENVNLALDSAQSHYLVHVLRAKQGDFVRLFNGMDGDWAARLAFCGKKAVHLEITALLRPQKPEPDLWLCCAPIKRNHFDAMIMKATELGVAKILPILTARTQIREINLARCQAIATEAAEQSERLSLPEIVKIQDLTSLTRTWDPTRPLYYCAEHGQAKPIVNILSDNVTQKKPSGAILVGPEGGLTTEELDILQNVRSSAALRLGPRILRADTAALAALACWQAHCGDWTEV